ncbi:uncharacterized protein LOC135209838 [Macrobrachium nipponense]|uniref:uncharacterized protein LOC135209838 n=1 Tax=Macrobrachium nipponense TaxID=159736 RepID=UPI0030C8D02D
MIFKSSRLVHNWLGTRAILAPKNDAVDETNLQMLNQLPSEECSYKSIDAVLDPDEVVKYPVGVIEYFNTLWTSTSPLKTQNFEKLGATKAFQCNSPYHENDDAKIMEATNIDRQSKWGRCFIPRIPLIQSDTPFEFQFKLSIAMGNNRAQGQSLDVVGVTLKEPMFSHGRELAIPTIYFLFISTPNGRTKN